MSDNISVSSGSTITNVSDQIDFDNINLSFNGCGFLGKLIFFLWNRNINGSTMYDFHNSTDIFGQIL